MAEHRYCDLEEGGYGMWCESHDTYATHVATDGDTPVCEAYAKRNGCNCGHYPDRSDESDVVRTLRMLSDALGDYDRYCTSEIEYRARDAVQEAVDQVIRELE